MDPNKTLEQAREIHAALAAGVYHHSDETIDALDELAGKFLALDEWLSRGGHLPTAWSGQVDKLNAYGAEKFGDEWWPGWNEGSDDE